MKRKQLYSFTRASINNQRHRYHQNFRWRLLVVSGGREMTFLMYTLSNQVQSRNKKDNESWKDHTDRFANREACGLINNRYLYTAGVDGIYNVYNIEENGKPAFKTAKHGRLIYCRCSTSIFQYVSFNEVINSIWLFRSNYLQIDVSNIFDKSNESIPMLITLLLITVPLLI